MLPRNGPSNRAESHTRSESYPGTEPLANEATDDPAPLPKRRPRTPLQVVTIVSATTVTVAGIAGNPSSASWLVLSVGLTLLIAASIPVLVPQTRLGFRTPAWGVPLLDLAAILLVAVPVPETIWASLVPLAWLAFTPHTRIAAAAALGTGGAVILAPFVGTSETPLPRVAVIVSICITVTAAAGLVGAYYRRKEEEQAYRIASMAHELRSSLTAAAGFVALAEENESIAEPVREDLTSASRSIELLRRHVSDLDASAPLSLQIEPCDLMTLVADAADAIRPAASHRGMRIDLELDDVTLAIDADRIHQVVTNLLNNAVKYAGPASTIGVAVRHTGQPGGAQIEVCDDGPGMSAEDRRVAFDPYHRAATARRSPVDGRGLGLTICREIVELHGGSITLDEAPGGGTRVTVELPGSRR